MSSFLHENLLGYRDFANVNNGFPSKMLETTVPFVSV